MRSLVTKCLALGIASMCLLGTAHTQQVPPELRGRIQKLQAREHALLDARRVLTDLVSDRANLVLPLQVSDDDDQTRLPVAVPRTAYAADLVLWATDEGNWISSPIARQIAPEGIMKWALQWDRVLRQVIQEHKIPEIDKELAQVRSEFDKLMARTGGRPSTAAATAASGILVVSGRLDQEDVDRRNQHLLRDFSYKASSYDAGSVTLEIFPPAASGRPVHRAHHGTGGFQASPSAPDSPRRTVRGVVGRDGDARAWAGDARSARGTGFCHRGLPQQGARSLHPKFLQQRAVVCCSTAGWQLPVDHAGDLRRCPVPAWGAVMPEPRRHHRRSRSAGTEA